MSSDGRVIGISVKSQAFLWNQVRRIASAVSGAVSGRNTLDDIRSALENPEIPLDLGRSPSDGLMLWAIENEESDGMTDGSMPDTSWFSTPPRDSREHTRWLALARLEMATLLEREWLKRLN
jgi:tRNA U38,U39,U40 pseudouridine synthase TruA